MHFCNFVTVIPHFQLILMGKQGLFQWGSGAYCPYCADIFEMHQGFSSHNNIHIKNNDPLKTEIQARLGKIETCGANCL